MQESRTKMEVQTTRSVVQNKLLQHFDDLKENVTSVENWAQGCQLSIRCSQGHDMQ